MDQPQLIIAAKSGDEAEVTKLIKAKADINESTSSGANALITAAEKNHLNIVKLLINAGADLNAEN